MNSLIRLRKLKIKNYKSLKTILLDIDEYLIIVGKNNCGKTNILEAVNLCFNYNSITKEDVYTSKEDSFNVEKKVIIELLFCPMDELGNESDSFDEEWMVAFGDRISFNPQTGKQFFAFRTELSYNANKEVYTNKKYIINTWEDKEESIIGKSINRDDLDCFFAIYINAQRDLALDISDRSSQWFKLTSGIKMAETDEKEIIEKIEEINKKIIDNNNIFQRVATNLKKSTSDVESNVAIVPITKDLTHLYKGMNVYYDDESIEPTSIERLGLGIRSWGNFSIIKSYIENEAEKNIKNDKAFHPILLVEEPESHLHPQAQRHFISNIQEIQAQKIITTHSPYILSQIDLNKILFVRKEGAKTIANRLITNGIDKEELININNKVMNTRGELLYSNFVVLAEGETEEFTLPIYFKKFFQKQPFELGVMVIGVSGSGQYKPYISILEKLGINWCIFSDGEDKPLKDIKSIFEELNLGEIENNSHLYYIPNAQCLETYLVDSKYKKYIRKAIDIMEETKNYLVCYKVQKQGQNRKEKYAKLIYDDKSRTFRDYSGLDGDIVALKDCLLENKIKYSKEIAIQIANKRKKIPKRIKKMLIYIKSQLERGD